MYSRNAADSNSICCTRYFTTSPIEMMPIRLFPSTTGKCRNLPAVISSIMLLIVSARVQVTTLRVITCPTGCSSAAAPNSANTRMMSRSEMMPAISRSDATRRQQLDCGRKVGGRLNGGDVGTFAIKNRFDGHGSSLPGSGTRPVPQPIVVESGLPELQSH